MATGGVLPQAYVPTLGTGTGQVDAYKKGQNVADVTAAQAQTGAMPVGAVTQATGIKAEDNQMITEGTGALGTQAPATQGSTIINDIASARKWLQDLVHVNCKDRLSSHLFCEMLQRTLKKEIRTTWRKHCLLRQTST